MDPIDNMAAHSMNLGKPTNTTAQVSKSFANMLGSAIGEVNDSQNASNQAVHKLINGSETDLHNVMIASEKASISLSTAVEIRDKAINAYQSIMRMQV